MDDRYDGDEWLRGGAQAGGCVCGGGGCSHFLLRSTNSKEADRLCKQRLSVELPKLRQSSAAGSKFVSGVGSTGYSWLNEFGEGEERGV